MQLPAPPLSLHCQAREVQKTPPTQISWLQEEPTSPSLLQRHCRQRLPPHAPKLPVPAPSISPLQLLQADQSDQQSHQAGQPIQKLQLPLSQVMLQLMPLPEPPPQLAKSNSGPTHHHHSPFRPLLQLRRLQPSPSSPCVASPQRRDVWQLLLPPALSPPPPQPPQPCVWLPPLHPAPLHIAPYWLPPLLSTPLQQRALEGSSLLLPAHSNHSALAIAQSAAIDGSTSQPPAADAPRDQHSLASLTELLLLAGSSAGAQFAPATTSTHSFRAPSSTIRALSATVVVSANVLPFVTPAKPAT